MKLIDFREWWGIENHWHSSLKSWLFAFILHDYFIFYPVLKHTDFITIRSKWLTATNKILEWAGCHNTVLILNLKYCFYFSGASKETLCFWFACQFFPQCMTGSTVYHFLVFFLFFEFSVCVVDSIIAGKKRKKDALLSSSLLIKDENHMATEYETRLFIDFWWSSDAKED